MALLVSCRPYFLYKIRAAKFLRLTLLRKLYGTGLSPTNLISNAVLYHDTCIVHLSHFLSKFETIKHITA